MLRNVDLMRRVVAGPDSRAVEEFEGEHGLHWWLGCVVRAVARQEKALITMVVVRHILEYAEGRLLRRYLLDHELRDHPFKTGF